MLDFTSALYLGLQHPSPSLRPWERLTAGVPAALRRAAGRRRTWPGRWRARRGCGAATLAHVDAAPVLGPVRGARRDGDVRSTSTPGRTRSPAGASSARRAAASRVAPSPTTTPTALERAARAADARRGRGRSCVTDGVLPRLRPDRAASRLPAIVRALGGRDLVVDDTQALGVLGDPGRPAAPYGRGGGGSLRWQRRRQSGARRRGVARQGLRRPARRAGRRPAELVARFEAGSETRVHCSPPSVAVLRAAEHALALNRRAATRWRSRLAAARARTSGGRLAELGLRSLGGLFPVQTLAPAPGSSPRRCTAPARAGHPNRAPPGAPRRRPETQRADHGTTSPCRDLRRDRCDRGHARSARGTSGGIDDDDVITASQPSTAFMPTPIESPGGGRIRDNRDPAGADLVTVDGYNKPVRSPTGGAGLVGDRRRRSHGWDLLTVASAGVGLPQ